MKHATICLTPSGQSKPVSSMFTEIGIWGNGSCLMRWNLLMLSTAA